MIETCVNYFYLQQPKPCAQKRANITTVLRMLAALTVSSKPLQYAVWTDAAVRHFFTTLICACDCEFV